MIGNFAVKEIIRIYMYLIKSQSCWQRNKAEVDRNKLREIEEQDERLAKIIQEQEKIKLKKAKQKKKKEQEEKNKQQVHLHVIHSILSLRLMYGNI